MDSTRRSPATTPARVNPGSVALDQWRGLALVMVLIAHGFHNSGQVDGLGRAGVNLFFFISGILVFRSLNSAAGGPWQRVSSFWYRRLRRLYPALLAYLGVALAGWLALDWVGRPTCFDRGFERFAAGLPGALLYFINYLSGVAPVLGHLWSLACEMQFYLLAPLFYLAAGGGSARRNLVFGGLLVVLLFLGAGEPFLFKNPFLGVKYHFEFAVWPMMAGFFCEYKRAWFGRIPERMSSWGGRVSVLVCAASFVPMLMGYSGKVLVVAGGALLLLPCLLAYAGGRPWPGRSGDVLQWLGVRTYSIYLWQQPLTICYFLPVVWWPLGALLSLPVGALWFRWFELPFLSASRQVTGGKK